MPKCLSVTTGTVEKHSQYLQTQGLKHQIARKQSNRNILFMVTKSTHDININLH